MSILNKLRKHEFYTGRKDKVFGEISVTEITGGSELQAYLARTNKITKEPKLSQATLGSIYDIGWRLLTDKFGLESGARMQYKLPNGWVLTGEPDMLDLENKIIYDNKLSKIYSMKKARQERATNGYCQQVNFYELMLGGKWKKILLWGLKDQSDVKHDHPDEAIVEQEVGDISEEALIRIAVDFTNKLDEIKETGFSPDKCPDRWSNDMRCKFFCSVSSHCEYAKKRKYIGGASSW